MSNFFHNLKNFFRVLVEFNNKLQPELRAIHMHGCDKNNVRFELQNEKSMILMHFLKSQTYFNLRVMVLECHKSRNQNGQTCQSST